MDKFVEYAPVVIVVIGFLFAYKVFVTPQQLSNELKSFEKELNDKFVHKETHNIIIAGIKEDITEIKEKIDVIYNKVMGID